MRLESVGKRYGARGPWVVRDVSAEVSPGTVVRLRGRNGSGKSTLLRVAAGVSLPSRGKVTGRPAAGFVPERFPPALPFTGREYLLHLARVHGLRGSSAAARTDEWLERLGAAGYADRSLRGLSKGMCQKIAIAQALLPRPGLLVLDEAWTGLDAAARGTLDAAALERAAEGGIVLFVDHDPRRLAGRAGEHWSIGDDGRVTMAPGDRPVGGEPTDDGVSVIELDGLDPVSAERLASLGGVLSAAGTGRVTARVAAARSDEVLRQVLAWDNVHVASVRPEDPVLSDDRGGGR